MKRTKVDLSIERDIVTGMIVSDRYLSTISTNWEEDLLESSAAKMIADWCLFYFKKYKKAPNIHIQSIFQNWKKKEHTNQDLCEMIEDLLAGLSDEYERVDQFNVDFLLDRTESYFKKRRLKLTIEEAEGLLLEGEDFEAEKVIKGMKTPNLKMSMGVNPYTDKEVIRDALEHVEEPLFTLPGAIGNMLNYNLVREGFLSILASEKAGKSWMLTELAHRAARSRCNVAFLGAGDMSRRQMVLRFQMRLTGKVKRSFSKSQQWIPVRDCKLNQLDRCPYPSLRSCSSDGIYISNGKGEKLIKRYEDTPENYVPCSACDDVENRTAWVRKAEKNDIQELSWKYGYKIGKRFEKRIGRNRLKLECWPNDTLTIEMIDNQLDLWLENEGWAADVVIIDYADILTTKYFDREERHKVNTIWKGLRRLSQERKCLLITATQANADSYKSSLLGLSNFSEDKRKYAHVTGMFGINRTSEEKMKNLMRLNWLVLRESEYNIERTVHVMQNLRQGKPLVDSW
ncbi:MAG: hypothetical protein ACTSX6_08205 [Candidatus Heimdallarchaeaceae archaeon]